MKDFIYKKKLKDLTVISQDALEHCCFIFPILYGNLEYRATSCGYCKTTCANILASKIPKLATKSYVVAKRPTVGVVWRFGERDVSSGVVHVI
ncbi:hypothetical protein AVEN_209555-1 [Araneus ventricosus]|uniref:Uncharacterized protein n=1 Tax=Araneus ventricosus TaxID=182803 RepID=A0A4Y2P4R3_ARAVE|nr:hypothetical protein AVEN_209555-1 [Araneus ventricosus]